MYVFSVRVAGHHSGSCFLLVLLLLVILLVLVMIKLSKGNCRVARYSNRLVVRYEFVILPFVSSRFGISTQFFATYATTQNRTGRRRKAHQGKRFLVVEIDKKNRETNTANITASANPPNDRPLYHIM
jgi:hypothetical protein